MTGEIMGMLWQEGEGVKRADREVCKVKLSAKPVGLW